MLIVVWKIWWHKQIDEFIIFLKSTKLVLRSFLGELCEWINIFAESHPLP